MTTVSEEWVSARDALYILAPLMGNDAHGAMTAILARAGTGMVKARASRLIVGAAATDNADVPAKLWQQRLGNQAWATGDFASQRHLLDDPWQAFGVLFLRSDIEQIVPSSAAVETRQHSPGPTDETTNAAEEFDVIPTMPIAGASKQEAARKALLQCYPDGRINKAISTLWITNHILPTLKKAGVAGGASESTVARVLGRKGHRT